jgi:hypothetical protein
MLALLIQLVLFLFVKGKMQMLDAGATTNPGPGSSTSSLLLPLTSSIPSGTYLVVHLFSPCMFNRFLDDPYPHCTSGRCDLVDFLQEQVF